MGACHHGDGDIEMSPVVKMDAGIQRAGVAACHHGDGDIEMSRDIEMSPVVEMDRRIRGRAGSGRASPW